MSNRSTITSKLACTFLFSSIFLSCLPGCVSSKHVTLESIQIFTTHEWFKAKPTIYFQCKGENKTVLPDVKSKGVVYHYKGQESFQPLMEIDGSKCKRCGIYELDVLKADDEFDEWEFCPSDFTKDGKYIHFKEKELNVTFLCQECNKVSAAANAALPPPSEEDTPSIAHIALVILITIVVSSVVIVGVLASFKLWQKKKRQQDQARFMQLFEENDDFEDELGLSTGI